MYRNTRFGELLKGLPRQMFEKNVFTYQGDRHSKGFTCWDQLLAMLFAQISGCKSLREIEAGFNSQSAAHYHLGCREIKRSTLADANAKRNVEVFSSTCEQLMQRVHRGVRSELKDLLYLLDSTPIPLKGRGYEWAEEKHNHRTKGLKVHMLYAPEMAMPVHTAVTYANVNDVEQGREIAIESGATYVFDKGYCDYNWWYKLHQSNAFFVTRLKKNAGIEPVKSLKVPSDAKEQGILEDAEIVFKSRRPGGSRINAYHGTPLRRILVDRPDKDSCLVIVTNDFSRSAIEIAGLYKKRWSIELFFKWLKQNLKIKSFVGQSENAVRIQLYTALIAYLLAYLCHRAGKSAQSLKLWVIELKSGLFQRPEAEQFTATKRRRELQELHRIQGVLAL